MAEMRTVARSPRGLGWSMPPTVPPTLDRRDSRQFGAWPALPNRQGAKRGARGLASEASACRRAARSPSPSVSARSARCSLWPSAAYGGNEMGRTAAEPQWNDSALAARWDPVCPKTPDKRLVSVHSDLALDLPVYRYMKAVDAFRTLSGKSLWFANPSRWDDPYEAMWCRSLFGAAGQNPLSRARAFGQCWTVQAFEEPFWRFQTRELPAVRIRSTVRSLVNWMVEVVHDHPSPAKAYIGAMRYAERQVLEKRAKALHAAAKQDRKAQLAASALHTKRRAYAFEKEVRLLWVEAPPEVVPLDGFNLPFDPDTVIDQVMIGPTTNQAALEVVKSELGRLGRRNVEVSSIYDLPKFEDLK